MKNSSKKININLEPYLSTVRNDLISLRKTLPNISERNIDKVYRFRRKRNFSDFCAEFFISTTWNCLKVINGVGFKTIS